MEEPIIKTKYALALEGYCASSDFYNSRNLLVKAGIMPPYCDNILTNAFDAGWNANTEPVYINTNSVTR